MERRSWEGPQEKTMGEVSNGARAQGGVGHLAVQGKPLG